MIHIAGNTNTYIWEIVEILYVKLNYWKTYIKLKVIRKSYTASENDNFK